MEYDDFVICIEIFKTDEQLLDVVLAVNEECSLWSRGLLSTSYAIHDASFGLHLLR